MRPPFAKQELPISSKRIQRIIPRAIPLVRKTSYFAHENKLFRSAKQVILIGKTS